MKGKKLFYFALFFSVITILYGCNERNSRAYLEDRIGNQISRVYPTKNLEDLFEQFPNGFTIYQSHTEGEYRIKVELTGDPQTKMIAGTIKKVNRKNREITSQVEVKYQNEEFSVLSAIKLLCCFDKVRTNIPSFEMGSVSQYSCTGLSLRFNPIEPQTDGRK